MIYGISQSYRYRQEWNSEPRMTPITARSRAATKEILSTDVADDTVEEWTEGNEKIEWGFWKWALEGRRTPPRRTGTNECKRSIQPQRTQGAQRTYFVVLGMIGDAAMVRLCGDFSGLAILFVRNFACGIINPT